MLKKAPSLSLARALKTEIPVTIPWLRNKTNLIHLYVTLPHTPTAGGQKLKKGLAGNLTGSVYLHQSMLT